MKDVEIGRDKLLAIVEANLATHQQVFAAAETGYRNAAVGRLKTMLEAVQSGKTIEQSVGLPVPVSHVEDYARAIRMLKLEMREVVSLSSHEFRELVDDEWDWSASFSSTSLSYSSSSSSSSSRSSLD